MDGLVLKEIPLSKERTTIGRKAHNDIQIDNLAVSGEHAVIVTILNDSFMEDLGSTNGTLVNGQSGQEAFPAEQRRHRARQYKLKFIQEAGAQPAAAAADFEKTMVLRPIAMKAAAEQAKAAGMGGAQAAQAARAAAIQSVGVAAQVAGIGEKPVAPAGGSGCRTRGRGGSAGGCEVRSAAGCDPVAVRWQRRQGTRTRETTDHAGQARRAGGGADAPPAGLLHHPRRGCAAPDGERPADRLRAARAEGPRPGRNRTASRWSFSTRADGGFTRPASFPEWQVKRYIARMLLGLAITLFFAGHAARLYRVAFIDQLDNIIYDTRLRLTMPGKGDPRIVILDIDEKSLGEVGRWPWSRNVMARLVDRLFDKYKVVQLGFDVVWAERDTSSGMDVLDALAQKELKEAPGYQAAFRRLRADLDYDGIFAASIKGRAVVLGYYFNGEENAVRANAIPAPILPKGTFAGRRVAFARWNGYTGNLPVFQQNAFAAGHFNPLVDDDGVSRRVPMVDGARRPVLRAVLAGDGAHLRRLRIRCHARGRAGISARPGTLRRHGMDQGSGPTLSPSTKRRPP